MDYILFTNSKMKDETVAKIIDTMANNKADMIAVAPALNDFSIDTMYRKHDHDLSSWRAEVFPGPQDRSQGVLANRTRRPSDRRSDSPRRGGPYLRRVGGTLHRQHGRVRLRTVEGDRAGDQYHSGAAGRLRRALGARRPAPGARRLVLHRAASVGDAGLDAGARLHHRVGAPAQQDRLRRRLRGDRRRDLRRLSLLRPARDRLADGRGTGGRRRLDLHREPRRIFALVRLALRHRLAAAGRLHHRPLRGADL